MELKTINGRFWKFWKFLIIVLLMILGAAAEPPPLTCSVTPLTDGSVLYRLSRAADTSRCDGRCWEDRDKTVIAIDSEFSRSLVLNLTNQSLQLKTCQDFMRYTAMCNKTWVEANCTFNCSELVDPSEHPLNTVNSTLTCIFHPWCPTPLHFGLGIFGIVLLLVGVAVGLHRWKVCKHRKGSADVTTSYTPANQQIKTEIIV